MEAHHPDAVSTKLQNKQENEVLPTNQVSVAPATTKLFVRNMHSSVTEGDLIKLFQRYGTVNEVVYMWHKVGPNRGKPKGFSFVVMATVEEAKAAIHGLNESIVKGRRLFVSFSDVESTHVRGYHSSTGIFKTANDGATKNANFSCGHQCTYNNTVPGNKSSVSSYRDTSAGTLSGSAKRSADDMLDDKMKRIRQALNNLQK